MKKYFADLEELHRFTLSLDYHQDITACSKCLKHDQLVSHGFVYKKQRSGRKRVVGKRIFCSNRFGRSGCGRTHRLYLCTEIPTLQYSADHLFVFITGLIACFSIQQAYATATKTAEPRNAYRWLNRLTRKLIEYRNLVRTPAPKRVSTFKTSTRRFQLLLPTLQRLFEAIGPQSCAQYQRRFQTCFV